MVAFSYAPVPGQAKPDEQRVGQSAKHARHHPIRREFSTPRHGFQSRVSACTDYARAAAPVRFRRTGTRFTTPRSFEAVGFTELRALADAHDITRLAIDTRKDQIAALDEADTAAAGTAVVPAPASRLVIGAERRQLTVMFCDLVGSTALSRQTDPEDLNALISAYHRAVAEQVGRFVGYVAKYMGDGVLSCFGYPQAHEDDTALAFQAGLAILDAVPGFAPAATARSRRCGSARAPGSRSPISTLAPARRPRDSRGTVQSRSAPT
jgi:hypothetical protein